MTRHRISLDEFHRMVEAGVFPEDLRLELVEGELLEMSPIGKRHAAKVARLTALLAPLVPEKAILFVQSPLVVGKSELYPDLALLPPRPDFYEEGLPEGKDALLVVEVAETSLAYDLGVKVPLYAKGGVPEVWVADLPGRRLWVHREPAGEGYREVRTLGPEDTVTFMGIAIPLGELL
ncbi:Uma2 family endonuclease [Thermus amyloliquefaciens]|uniref:Uma2 family endonuclease n=1 Tax=Thermus amyloliquefaciens TaxID=1449080 RepID=UPI00056DEE32|nr:Uma2 family endonuclease [Thermus amyloliquefaciens]